MRMTFAKVAAGHWEGAHGTVAKLSSTAGAEDVGTRKLITVLG